MSENLALIDALVEAGFSSTNARELAAMIGGAGLSAATLEDGVAKFEVGEQTFAMLPVDEEGGLTANIGHRRGLVANLLALDGVDGEISVPTDSEDLVIHNGVAGQARRFRSAVSSLTQGTDSLAVGAGAATASRATKSLALGAGAEAQHIGEIVFGGFVSGIQRHLFTFAGRTTSTTTVTGSLSGQTTGIPDGGLLTYLPDGIYDAEVVVLARQSNTNGWARFVRRATLLVDNIESATGISNITTPTPDVNNDLAGLSIQLLSNVGTPLAPRFTGLAGTTIQWSAFVTLNGLSILE